MPTQAQTIRLAISGRHERARADYWRGLPGMVGAAVGATVGKVVGAVVGAEVEREVGAVVGRVVRAVVGVMVGVMVGRTLGRKQHTRYLLVFFGIYWYLLVWMLCL